MPPLQDLTGKKFGRWTVLRRAEDYCPPGGARPRPQWLCLCECGTEGITSGQNLREGVSRSCGCLNRDVHRQVCIDRNTTHGQSPRKGRSPTYRVWINLPTRRYKGYDPVPEICERWKSFENFLTDMGERPVGMTIDRIDNSKGYEPGNCRWASMKTQQNNRTNNRRITYRGQTMTLAQWAEATGLDRSAIAQRIKLGWSVERALTEPSKRGRNQYD